MANVYVDKNYIKQLFADTVLKEAENIILEKVNREIAAANKNLISTFLRNKITQELQAGPNAKNVSNILGGEGNLFSFLGFENGDDPIGIVVDFLTNSIKMRSVRINKDNYTIIIDINIPTIEDLKDITELSWINRSWIDAIEKGISGLGQYLYSEFGFETSRSGSGIQSKKTVRSASMKPQKYMTEILESVADKLINKIKE